MPKSITIPRETFNAVFNLSQHGIAANRGEEVPENTDHNKPIHVKAAPKQPRKCINI